MIERFPQAPHCWIVFSLEGHLRLMQTVTSRNLICATRPHLSHSSRLIMYMRHSELKHRIWSSWYAKVNPPQNPQRQNMRPAGHCLLLHDARCSSITCIEDPQAAQ